MARWVLHVDLDQFIAAVEVDVEHPARHGSQCARSALALPLLARYGDRSSHGLDLDRSPYLGEGGSARCALAGARRRPGTPERGPGLRQHCSDARLRCRSSDLRTRADLRKRGFSCRWGLRGAARC
ncbi:hypothetical protein DXX98_03635 [Janibacter melonis]|nr:hypothetical protein [Janibacter melonis]